MLQSCPPRLLVRLVQSACAAALLCLAPALSIAQVTTTPGGSGGSEPSRSLAPATERTLRVVVSIPPVQGIVQPILSDSGIKHSIDTLVPVGVSEHGYEIPPAKLTSLSRADVIVIVGLGLEPQVEKFIKEHRKPTQKVLVLADASGIKADPHDHEHHHHAPGEECNHVVDPHIWLDPVLVEKQVSAAAQMIRDALGADAEAVKRVWVAEEGVLKRVKETHEAYAAAMKAAPKRTIVVGHDAWGYLANRYDLKTVAIKGLTATEPTPKALEEASRTIREQKLTSVFVEPQLSQQAGKRIAASTGVQVRTLDPLGKGDWFAMMDANLKELKAALEVPESTSAEPASR